MENVLTYSRPLKSHFPWYGYVAAVWLIVAEAFMFARMEPFLTWFTPIQWTGLIFLLDAILVKLGEESLIFRRTRDFVYMLFVSNVVWFMFEGYNLHLQNWKYIGLPESYWVRAIGYVWSFATIFPGVLLTSQIIDRLGVFDFIRFRPVPVSRGLRLGFMIFGFLSVTVPLLVPQEIARYLFAFVWVGFVFLIDPINYSLGMPSLLRELEQGTLRKLFSLFLAGIVCGFLWEFWNYWAGTKWIYTVPFLTEPKIFEMPLFGFLGFLPFAAECYVFWQLSLWVRQRLSKKDVAGEEVRA